MNAIVVTDKQWAIGRSGDLLFSLPGDMKHFRTLTTGGTVIMGRKTLDSFPGGRPLPKRRNIVITRSPDFHREGCETVSTPEDALALAGDEENVWLIGGGSIYAALLGRCRRASVTRVDSTVSDADTFFPDLDALPNWKIERTGEAVTENGLTYRFVDYVNTAVVSQGSAVFSAEPCSFLCPLFKTAAAVYNSLMKTAERRRAHGGSEHRCAVHQGHRRGQGKIPGQAGHRHAGRPHQLVPPAL